MDYSSNARSRRDPATGFRTVTPADADLPEPLRAIYVGTGGDLVVVGEDGVGPVTFKAFAGATIVGTFKQVRAATTATNLVGLV